MDTVKVEALITTGMFSIVEYQGRVYILPSSEIVVDSEGVYTRLFFLSRANLVNNTINARFLLLAKELNKLDDDMRYDAMERLEDTIRGL